MGRRGLRAAGRLGLGVGPSGNTTHGEAWVVGRLERGDNAQERLPPPQWPQHSSRCYTGQVGVPAPHGEPPGPLMSIVRTLMVTVAPHDSEAFAVKGIPLTKLYLHFP